MRRKKLTPAQRLDVLHSNGGVCYLCNEPINLARIRRGEAEGFEVEHIHALALGGGDDPSNWRPAHISCHKKKTRRDRRAMAKARRGEAKRNGTAKPRFKKKIASRGFDKGPLMKRPDGEIVDRKTGGVVRPGWKP
ncbi:HNH endonuclease [Salipiger sp.]|uniref:HNH endonuclease n=1 Tax=Salipiger sp. TaxID=2078585 RepID=UPI003A97AB6A